MPGNSDNLRLFLLESFYDIEVFIEAMKHGEVPLFDREIVYEDSNLPDHIGEVYGGYDGVLRAAERWLEGADQIRLTLDEIIGAGDHIVSVHTLRSRAEHTRIEFEGTVAYHWTFRNGKVVHLRSFRSREEALAAAGLSDPPCPG